MAIAEAFFLFVAIVCLLTLVVLKRDPAECEDGDATVSGEPMPPRWTRLLEANRSSAAAAETAARSRPVVLSKETIAAMAQRGVYGVRECALDWATGAGDDSEDGQWARDIIAASCARLDACEPDVEALVRVVNDFCDRMDKTLAAEEANLCKFRDTVSLVTGVRLSLMEEVNRSAVCEVDDKQSVDDRIDDSCRKRKLMRPARCPVVADTVRADEDFLFTIYEQFVDEIEHSAAKRYVNIRDIMCEMPTLSIGGLNSDKHPHSAQNQSPEQSPPVQNSDQSRHSVRNYE